MDTLASGAYNTNRSHTWATAPAALLVFAALASPFLHAQQASGPGSGDAIDKICDTVEDVPIPPRMLPDEEQYIQWKSCSPLALYYGQPESHFKDALTCAMVVEETPEGERRGNALDADLVLTMVFSNGEGATRNLPLARHFACKLYSDTPGPASFDTAATLHTIESNKKLDFCHSDIGYGRTPGYYCILLSQDRVNAETQAENQRAKKLLPANIWAAWNALDRARADYSAARKNEQSSGTTGIDLFNLDLDEAADETWLGYLRAIESGAPPKGVLDPGDYKSADAQLNQSYDSALLNAKQNCSAFNVCPEAIRTTERAWLRYREAWVRLAALRWPEIPADRWRRWLSETRSEELDNL